MTIYESICQAQSWGQLEKVIFKATDTLQGQSVSGALAGKQGSKLSELKMVRKASVITGIFFKQCSDYPKYLLWDWSHKRPVITGEKFQERAFL